MKKPLIEAVLFDLDGTLIDSVPDITGAVAELMGQNGLPAHSQAAVRKMIGQGVSKLVERAFASHGVTLTGADLAQKTQDMVAIYPRHLVEKTVLIDGAGEALAALQTRGVRMALVTNKPEASSKTILAHFGIAAHFALIVGDLRETGAPLRRKPHPDMLNAALDALGIAPQKAAMVGDSEADIGAARAAGVLSVAVAGGYSDKPVSELGADRVIASLHALLPALGLI